MPEFDKRQSRPRRQRTVIRRKENIFVGILSGLFPWKGDSAGNMARKLIFLASLCLIIYAGIALVNFYVIRDRVTDLEKEKLLSALNDYEGPEVVTIYLPADENTPEKAEPEPVEAIGEYYETYYTKNEDFVGYLEIFPIVQYPVYQSDDNEFYLNHNHEKIPTANGTIFADCEGVFTPTSRPNNTIIYGHNLLTKNLFQPLKYYYQNTDGSDSFDFLKEHATIKFDTLYERGAYKIFAVFQSNIKETHGEVFYYWRDVYFKDKSHFDNFIADCLDRSFFYTNLDLQYGDEILMLSTCDFSMFANGADSSVRCVIAARRVRDDELPDFTQEELNTFIDNRGFNASGQVRRKMFDAYYDTFCKAGWAGRNWDLDYIKDFNN